MPAVRKKKKRQPPLNRLIRKYLRYWRKKFRLPDWPIFFQGVKDLKSEVASLDCLATIRINTDSNEILLKYDTGLRPDESIIKRLMAHEVLHWLFDEVDTFVGNKMSNRDHKHYRDVQEKVIEELAVALSGVEQDKPAYMWWFEPTTDECKH